MRYVLVFDDQKRAIGLGVCANEADAEAKARAVLALTGLDEEEFTWGFENGEFWVCPLTGE